MAPFLIHSRELLSADSVSYSDMTLYFLLHCGIFTDKELTRLRGQTTQRHTAGPRHSLDSSPGLSVSVPHVLVSTAASGK